MKKLVFLLTIAMTLSACSKMNKENYDQLKLGMSQQEVKAIIGSPDNCSETLGTTSCIWGDEEGKYIKITFLGDNATTFSNNGLK